MDGALRMFRPVNPTIQGELRLEKYVISWTVWRTSKYLAELSFEHRQRNAHEKRSVISTMEDVTIARSLFAAGANCIDMLADSECTDAILQALRAALNGGITPKTVAAKVVRGREQSPRTNKSLRGLPE